MPGVQFQLPIEFDLFATFLFALTGGLLGMRKGYDVVGVWVLALVTGVGGGLIRDGLFLQQGPPVAITDSRYLIVVTAATAFAIMFGRHLDRFGLVFMLVDGLGLGAYSVVGAEKATAAGLAVVAAVLVGVTNAVGGSLLRDVLVREEPVLFKPNQLYALAALVGTSVFLALTQGFQMDVTVSAIVGIAVSFVVRVLSVWLDWRTKPLYAHKE